MVLGNPGAAKQLRGMTTCMKDYPLLYATFAATTYPAALGTSSTASLRGRPAGCQAAWRGGRGIATPACGAAPLRPAQLAVSYLADTQSQMGTVLAVRAAVHGCRVSRHAGQGVPEAAPRHCQDMLR